MTRPLWYRGFVRHWAAGWCVLTRSKIPRNASVNLTVLGASSSHLFYAPAGYHDPDGGSNGTTISISRQ